MDITPTPLGAAVDVTDPALGIAIELIADAVARDEKAVVTYLLELARARLNRDHAAARVERPGVSPLRDQVLEAAEAEVDALRGLIAARIDPDATVTVLLTEAGCRKAGGELLAAADETETAKWHRQHPFPKQQDRRVA
jgi:hypothetical protein